MKGYGKKRCDIDPCYLIGYLGNNKHSFAVYRSLTPFSRRRYKVLTTNKAVARREGRIACMKIE